MKSEGKNKNGAFNGKVKTYFEDGQLETVMDYSGGIPDGKCEEYYRNGNLKTKGKFEKVKKLGNGFTIIKVVKKNQKENIRMAKK